MSAQARVLSVNVGRPRTIDYNGTLVTSAIWKEPVEGRVEVSGVNLAGDDQADRSLHGGPDKAVYAYSRRDYEWWEQKLGRPMPAATFGENLTVTGVDPAAAVIGEHWRIGSTLLQVSEPRFPCYKLGVRMDDPGFLRLFAAARRPGTYLSIVEGGELGRGDPIEIEGVPEHGVSIADFTEAFLGDREQLIHLLRADQLSDSWRSWILKAVDRRGAG